MKSCHNWLSSLETYLKYCWWQCFLNLQKTVCWKMPYFPCLNLFCLGKRGHVRSEINCTFLKSEANMVCIFWFQCRLMWCSGFYFCWRSIPSCSVDNSKAETWLCTLKLSRNKYIVTKLNETVAEVHYYCYFCLTAFHLNRWRISDTIDVNI